MAGCISQMSTEPIKAISKVLKGGSCIKWYAV